MVYDVVVIGGGIVGLATAMKLLEQQPALKVVVLEKESRIAQHQTGNNSGVIHSGVYYKPGSLKAKNCLEGYKMLLEFCKAENIPFEICGKIIVAVSENEIGQLQNIYARGVENGLTGIKLIDKEEIKAIEPHCAGVKGIFVPQTGIINYTEVSKRYFEKIIAAKGEIRLGEKVVDIQQQPSSIKVITATNEFETRLVVNCAGLYSDKIAALTNANINIKIIPFRGEYYVLKKTKEHLVKNLIYPVPDPAFPFLGVHFTRFIEGGVEAGPNAVLAYAREGYTKSKINLPELFETLTFSGFIKVAKKYWKTGAAEIYRSYSKAAFTTALQRLIPEVQKNDLMPGEAGVRASAIDAEGNMVDDFVIEQQQNIIHVLNSPSPAATASLSIGKHISEMAIKML